MSAAPTRAARIAKLAGIARCVNALLLVLHNVDPVRQVETQDTCEGLADDLANGLAELARNAS